MPDVLASGKAVLTEWISKLPEADRAAAQAIVDKAEAQDAVKHVGESALRQSDYSRVMAELQEKVTKEDAYHTELETWATTKAAELKALQDYKALHPEQPAGGTHVPNNPDPATATIQSAAPADPTKTRDEIVTQIRKEMDAREQDYAAFLAESQPLGIRHFQQFGEVLDLRKLMTHPEIGKVGLKGVYDIVFADQLRAKVDAAKAAEVKAIEEAAYARARSDLLAQGAVVFPPPTDGGSPLEVLGRKPAEGTPPIDLARAATQEYEAAVAKANA